MFVTLDDFFNNYRIKNQQQPNETVLNKGLIRLKRETRELKSLVDILIDKNLPAWSASKIYEIDEYISHENLLYRSRIDQNFNITPFTTDTVSWELVTFDTLAQSKGTVTKSEAFDSTEGQATFTVSFNIDSTPMVFVEGSLLAPDAYTYTSNTVTVNDPLNATEKVIISAGITYDSTLSLAKNKFTATASQYLFVTSFTLSNPSVFVDGQLIDDTLYTYYGSTVDFITPMTGGELVVIGNGSVLGNEIYSPAEVDALLAAKRDITDSYSIAEVDTIVAGFATDAELQALSDSVDAAKADKATTLAGYGITDAYTITTIDSALALKLDAATYTGADILSKLINVDGEASGLDADLVHGKEGWTYINIDSSPIHLSNFTMAALNNKATYLGDNTTVPEPINEIFFDVDELGGFAGDPKILIRKYDVTQALVSEGEVYHSANTSHMMVIKEGYFKGTWEPSLDVDFGIGNYTDYNWAVIVTPVVTGTEHDFNAEAGHTPYAGFDNNLTWDANQSEYHYGYISGANVKMKAEHRDGVTIIDLPARYHLVGIVKTFSSIERVDGPGT